MGVGKAQRVSCCNSMYDWRIVPCILFPSACLFHNRVLSLGYGLRVCNHTFNNVNHRQSRLGTTETLSTRDQPACKSLTPLQLTTTISTLASFSSLTLAPSRLFNNIRIPDSHEHAAVHTTQLRSFQHPQVAAKNPPKRPGNSFQTPSRML